MKAPTNVNELQRMITIMIGMINFVAKFLPSARLVLAPINEFLYKDVAWN